MPPHDAPVLPCPQHAALALDIAEIKTALDAINGKLGTGTVNFATISLRLRAIEAIVYGTCGVIGLSVLGALCVLLVRS